MGIRYSTRIEIGDPAEKIVEVANQMGVEMIIVGFHGLKGIAKLKALSSASRTVVESSEISVLLVPRVSARRKTRFNR